VTEVRNELLQQAFRQPTTVGSAKIASSLAIFNFQIDADLKANSNSITIDEEERPFLLQTRLLQEWLLCGRTAGWVPKSSSGGTTDHGSLVGLNRQ